MLDATGDPLLVSEAGVRASERTEHVMGLPEAPLQIGVKDQKGAQLSIDHPPGEPFRLAGSIEILVSDEALEQGMAAERRRQTELAAAKFDDV